MLKDFLMHFGLDETPQKKMPAKLSISLIQKQHVHWKNL